MAMSPGKTQSSAPLLSPADPPPFRFIDRRSSSRRLVVADHAGNAVPGSLQGLGLDQDVFRQHIAVDIGSRALAARLAELLGSSLLLANYSRLVVDLNRHLDDPTAFISESDGIAIPGNQNLGAADKRRRADAIHHPYHKAIDNLIDDFMKQGSLPVIISMHSFTPVLEDVARPWHIGVLWDKDPRIAHPLLARLRQNPELLVGDNEPYSGRHPSDYTVDYHGEGRGVANVSIEVRQDLLGDNGGIGRWGALLAEALTDILADESLYRYLESE
ncbi:MAG: N-formylglutamate amidohydrolase [Gammaproteobacteria bacterium]|nr:N-formylglutamate amidohydrolase [Gammaproteobacteria bacterium]